MVARRGYAQRHQPGNRDVIGLDPASGWLTGVRRVPSPHCDQRPPGTAIDLLVIHSISLPPGHYGGSYIDQLFTGSLDPTADPYFAGLRGLRVSAHALIDRQGGVTQYVSVHHRAWHAGVSSFAGRPACNDYSIGIELEGFGNDLYKEDQYQLLAQLTRVLIRAWPGILPDRIVGHCHIAPGRKADPGPAFRWDKYRDLINKNLE